VIGGILRSITDYRAVPRLDEQVRQRLAKRFGDDVQSWLDELPGRLLVLKERWSLELDAVIPRGSMSVVIRCRTPQGQRAVLKISPDRERLVNETACLAHWSTIHVPTVLRADASTGALLMEEIEPGTTLQDSGTYPALSDVAQLLTALHTQGTPNRAFPSVADHVAYLFASWARPRQRDPTLVELVPPDLFDRGRRLALRLAQAPSPTVLLHGDLTPVNVLDGGGRRGLVAIDPAACLGDPALDAIDLLFWQAGDLDTISRRVELLAPAIGVDATRLLNWTTAFAGMFALDLAELPDSRSEDIRAALSLAAQAPSA
jgi:streptomycin 6-kinase